MSFIAILFALLLEQARPLARGNVVHAGLRHWTWWACRNLDAGRAGQAWAAWAVAVVAPALLALGVHWVLWHGLGAWASVLWQVAVLYVTLGFRQFSHYFTAIRDALEAGDEETARTLLASWRQVDAHELPRSEIVRHVIEHSVLAAHRHVFGVLAWYTVGAALGLGPAGAVFYRMAELVPRYWPYKGRRQSQPVSLSLMAVARRMWFYVDYVPARITALCFAIVGSFEDAIDNWRQGAHRFNDPNDGVVLAATAGAMGVRLGGAVLPQLALPNELPTDAADAAPRVDGDDLAAEGAGAQAAQAADTAGREPQVAHLRSVVGLVWRTVVLWMLLLALLTLARFLG
ncbi:MAG: Cobalamin biosynthesis protein CobD [Paracidovorax wautersii]|uniref:Cobalamin biosynthesis protein CobD n=1 Tax=Paracidovorax wautersii TaxID=1177982 RepID=A0A7V8FQE0_9BURK|nr:MAG: Cobalamin biosynthesis protein CobD [Paracidovorax wautersii]